MSELRLLNREKGVPLQIHLLCDNCKWTVKETEVELTIKTSLSTREPVWRTLVVLRVFRTLFLSLLSVEGVRRSETILRRLIDWSENGTLFF